LLRFSCDPVASVISVPVASVVSVTVASVVSVTVASVTSVHGHPLRFEAVEDPAAVQELALDHRVPLEGGQRIVEDGYEAEFCKHGRERNYGIFAAERKFGGMPEGLQETMHELQINNNIRVIGCQGQCET